jgi:hypothetical protein
MTYAAKKALANSAPVDLAKATIAVRVSAGKIGSSRQVGTEQIEVDADKDLLRVSKRLFDSPEFRAIKNLDSQVMRYLRNKALPFLTGVHLVPVPMVEEIDARLLEFAEERGALVDAFIYTYPALCAAAPATLRALHNPFDYPSVDYVRSKFYFTWQYVEYGVPGALKAISSKLWQDEQRKFAASMADAAEEIRQALRGSLLELVATMRDRLNTPDGKPRIFAPACKNLGSFLADFKFRNVANDSELQALVEQAKAMMDGAAPEALKDNEALRAAVRGGMDELAAKLKTMVVAKPSRKIRLED